MSLLNLLNTFLEARRVGLAKKKKGGLKKMKTFYFESSQKRFFFSYGMLVRGWGAIETI